MRCWSPFPDVSQSTTYELAVLFLLVRINDDKKLEHQLDQCLAADETVGLYLVILDFLREELETTDLTKGCMKKVGSCLFMRHIVSA